MGKALVGLLIGVIFLTAGLNAQEPPEKQRNPESPEVFTVKGKDDPGMIPDFVAWKHFFQSVDWQYRKGLGFVYGFVNMRLKIGGLLMRDEATGQAVLMAIIDHATLAQRDQERYRAEANFRQKSVEVGGLTAAEAEAHNLDAFGDQVRALQNSVESLCQRVQELDPVNGGLIWGRIREYVTTTVKESITSTIGPDMRTYEMMKAEFKTPPDD